MIQAICVGLGCVCLALGALGMVLPILPTVPFLMAAALLFARGSKRLDAWFRSSELYKRNLEGYVAGRGMTRAVKVRIMTMVTLLLGVGFAVMGEAPLGHAILIAVWLGHVAFFTFWVKTSK